MTNPLLTEELITRATELLRNGGRPTVSHVQHHLRIGYTLAFDLMEALEFRGIVTPADHLGRREVVPLYQVELMAAGARAVKSMPDDWQDLITKERIKMAQNPAQLSKSDLEVIGGICRQYPPAEEKDATMSIETPTIANLEEAIPQPAGVPVVAEPAPTQATAEVVTLHRAPVKTTVELFTWADGIIEEIRSHREQGMEISPRTNELFTHLEAMASRMMGYQVVCEKMQEVRRLQREYFSTRDKAMLEQSKSAERQLDMMLENLDSKKG